jgi:hypothetical protein
MIDLSRISCKSDLFDQTGVVFEYDGRIMRALLPRGTWIFGLLAENGLVERLSPIGLPEMRPLDQRLEGFAGLIECERFSPIVPPHMWTNRMLLEAGLTVCNLSRESLTNNLLLWDLKCMTNMTYSATRGPVFLDLGGFYTIEEVESHILHTSHESLVGQIASSFYAPLWLVYGPMKNAAYVRRLANLYRNESTKTGIAVPILRRLTGNWRLLPGMRNGLRLLKAKKYSHFYDSIINRLLTWARMDDAGDGASAFTSAEALGGQMGPILQLLKNWTKDVPRPVFFDLFPASGYGMAIAEKDLGDVYGLTPSEQLADRLFAWRKQTAKPLLPVLCNVWDKSYSSSACLWESCDVVFALPNILELARAVPVPLDFIGQMLAKLTRKVAVVGISGTSSTDSFPGFVAPSNGTKSSRDFVVEAVGKYFKSCEQIDLGPSSRSIAIFRK